MAKSSIDFSVCMPPTIYDVQLFAVFILLRNFHQAAAAAAATAAAATACEQTLSGLFIQRMNR